RVHWPGLDDTAGRGDSLAKSAEAVPGPRLTGITEAVVHDLDTSGIQPDYTRAGTGVPDHVRHALAHDPAEQLGICGVDKVGGARHVCCDARRAEQFPTRRQ